MENNFGVGSCGMIRAMNQKTFGNVMQNKRLNKAGVLGTGQSSDDRENFAFVCANDMELAAGGSVDDATFNSYLDICRAQYDAMGGNYPVDDDGTGDDIPQEYEPEGKKCTDPAVIYYVQMMTGNPNPDGSWGPESQKYLDASGKTFKEVAGPCEGAAPVYKEPGGSQPVDPGNEIKIDVTTGKKVGWLGLPWWAWVLIGVGAVGVGAGGVYVATRDNEDKEPKLDMEVSEPKPKFVRKIEKKVRGKKIAKSMKRDSKGRFVAKKSSYSRM